MPYRISLHPADNPGQSSVGGELHLARGRYPRCALCDARMVGVLQIVLPEDDVLPFAAGSRLVVLMCPTHNEALLHPAEWGRHAEVRAPEAFWSDRELRHVYFALIPPGTDTKVHPPDPFLAPHRIELEAIEEETEQPEGVAVPLGVKGFKVGGAPAFRQQARPYRCACGAEMALLLQVPANHVFRKKGGAPEQPDTSDSRGYVLTLGNGVYLMACTETCHPRAVWGVNQ